MSMKGEIGCVEGRRHSGGAIGQEEEQRRKAAAIKGNSGEAVLTGSCGAARICGR